MTDHIQPQTKIRLLGWLQLVIGLFLVGLMGTVTYNLAPGLLNPGVRLADGSEFTGTAEQSQLIFGLFGLLIFFGVMNILSGLWQIKTGRRNKALGVIMLVLFVALIVVAWVVRRAVST